MKKNILEILVDKNNEKGPKVFEEILIVLHKAYDQEIDTGFFSKKEKITEVFSYEIVKAINQIRFFIKIPNKYKQFLINQIYAHFSNVQIEEREDILQNIPDEKISVGLLQLGDDTFKGTYPNSENIDIYGSITSALSKTNHNSYNSIQINFFPICSDSKQKNVYVQSTGEIVKKIVILPLKGIILFINLLLGRELTTKKESSNSSSIKKGEDATVKNEYRFSVGVNIVHAGEDAIEGKMIIKEIISTLSVNTTKKLYLKTISQDSSLIKNVKSRISEGKNFFTLNSQQLSGLVHLPTNYVKTPQINWVKARSFQPPSNLPLIDRNDENNQLTPVGITDFRGTNLDFGIDVGDRNRHMYIIGKTGMGKSTLLENMIIDDIRKGRGVAVIDPHGDLAEAVIGFIPKSRTNQTIIFDPSDIDSPIAFNMLDGVSPDQRPLVASGLVGIFKKIFGDSWGPRLEHILRNTILALIEYPGTTLISIPLMLTNEVYRNKVVAKVTDPVVKNFWKQEFAKMAPNQKTEAAGPILNKVGQFLSSTILRNILGQSKNSFNLRWAMDNKKIIIVNLSKGKIGEDASALLGAMMVTKFQMDAMSRADIPESKRINFYLYVDEFQNFATDSFATILSEARKYKLNLVMANQFIDQMSEEVRGAVFGNVGSLVSFQVGHNDAAILKDVYSGDIIEDDLMNMKKYNIYTKLLVDGMPTTTFSAATYPPHRKDDKIFESRYQKILQVSREKYAKPKQKVEQSINKMLKDVEESEEQWEKKKEDFKNNKNKEKKKAHEERMIKQQVGKK